ncbi:hypothetical protein OIDMADRAFT_175561 [Oidiodendron maius Zn]|uniref:Uncharacterized protein n=1 Tax=Oidiodendron maius (strain Zn) TaxID=913774 RepID=A0A0C3I3A3_OIDMZ|nr:hypothetical protein OIDMADRAFT_175561 [Oidiodendron maius Zn]
MALQRSPVLWKTPKNTTASLSPNGHENVIRSVLGESVYSLESVLEVLETQNMDRVPDFTDLGRQATLFSSPLAPPPSARPPTLLPPPFEGNCVETSGQFAHIVTPGHARNTPHDNPHASKEGGGAKRASNNYPLAVTVEQERPNTTTDKPPRPRAPNQASTHLCDERWPSRIRMILSSWRSR